MNKIAIVLLTLLLTGCQLFSHEQEVMIDDTVFIADKSIDVTQPILPVRLPHYIPWELIVVRTEPNDAAPRMTILQYPILVYVVGVTPDNQWLLVADYKEREKLLGYVTNNPQHYPPKPASYSQPKLNGSDRNTNRQNNKTRQRNTNDELSLTGNDNRQIPEFNDEPIVPIIRETPPAPPSNHNSNNKNVQCIPVTDIENVLWCSSNNSEDGYYKFVE